MKFKVEQRWSNVTLRHQLEGPVLLHLLHLLHHLIGWTGGVEQTGPGRREDFSRGIFCGWSPSPRKADGEWSKRGPYPPWLQRGHAAREDSALR
jgi:hypothetical protein